MSIFDFIQNLFSGGSADEIVNQVTENLPVQDITEQVTNITDSIAPVVEEGQNIIDGITKK